LDLSRKVTPKVRKVAINALYVTFVVSELEEKIRIKNSVIPRIEYTVPIIKGTFLIGLGFSFSSGFFVLVFLFFLDKSLTQKVA
jgi:hypothetical protein